MTPSPQTQFIKPAAGLKVRDPKGGHLPAEGTEVTLDSYWIRRIQDGDVVKAAKPKAAPATQTKGPKS